MIRLNYVVFFTLFSFFANSEITTSTSEAVSICQESLKKGDYQQALQDCQKQLFDSQQKDNISDTIFLYLYLADIYQAIGKTQEEEAYLLKVAQHPLFHSFSQVSYQWNRKKGQKYYFSKNFDLAKKHLYQALSIAQTENNLAWISTSYNDVGLIESQLGEFRKSLINYQKSLNIKLKQGNLFAIGTTLNNIGLIYSKLENYQESSSYYEKALDSFLKYTQEENFDQRVFSHLNHLYEDLAVVYSHLKDQNKQSYYQERTIESIESKNSARQQARALINIARIQINNSKFDSAETFLNQALVLQQQHQFNLKTDINFQFARLYLLTAKADRAISLANSELILAKKEGDFLRQSKLYQILSQAYKKADVNAAYHYLNLHNETREKYLEQKFNLELKSVQLQIEKQQIEHTLELQQAENSKNKARIQALTAWSLAAIALLLLSIVFIVFYLFKKRKEKQDLLLSIKHHQQQLLLLDDKYQTLNKSITANKPYKENDNKQQLREILVKTMLDAVSIWESHTGKNRVELAEKSKIWTVSIDSGTLRTRSLDKYLSIEKIPQNPRWRNVAGTCHFVLSDPELNSENRAIMNQRLDSLMPIVKGLSLVSNSES